MKFKLTLIALLAMLIFNGCGEDESKPYTCSTCVNEPEASASNNSSGKGIYKGVVVGSSGTIKIDLDNAGNGDITAILILDGEEIELTTDGTFNGGFEGSFYSDRNTETTDDDISFTFATPNDGSMYGINNIIIPGHENVNIRVMKELSTAIVKGFEGTFSGDNSGVFNMVMLLNENGSGLWYSVSKNNPTNDNPNPEPLVLGGEVSENGTIVFNGLIILNGTMSGDIISGTWISDQGTVDEENGTWKGKRTL